jgi:hypothetical protein
MPINVNIPTNDAINVFVSSGTEINWNNRFLSDGFYSLVGTVTVPVVSGRSAAGPPLGPVSGIKIAKNRSAMMAIVAKVMKPIG